jgi:hypothetical protein
MFRKCITVALVAVTLLASGLHAQEDAPAAGRREAAMDAMGGKEMKQDKVCRKAGGSGGGHAVWGKRKVEEGSHRRLEADMEAERR